MTSSAPGSTPAAEPAVPDRRTVSTTTATAIAIADMIGIGVFTSLGFQLAAIPSGFSILMLWIVGGAAALCGALAYAELAVAFPRSGGEYNFLSRIYHPALGFMAGWISATVGFAAPVALAAMAFGEYFAGVVPGAPPLFVGLAVAWAVTLILLSGAKLSTTFQNVSTLIKVALIAVFIIAGFSVAEPQPISFLPQPGDIGHILSAPFAVSLVFVMYSYSGWNAATYIAGDVRTPERSIPVAMLVATLIVVLLYVLLNAVFLYTTPMAAMTGQLNVAQVAGEHIFGATGGRIVAGLICVGLVSAISAMMWIGPRVTVAMGEDFPLLSLFSQRSRSGVPTIALLFQISVVTVLLLTQSFETVLEFIQFSLTLCSFLAVLGVIVLRVTQPGLPRPYRVWAYPLTPLVFLGVTGFMMYYLFSERPLQSLASLGLMASGLVLFFLSKRDFVRGEALQRAVKG
ncbi:MAG TPA: amino acid permease [Hyphomicrobium zavarzinii]|uniref:APC family permease n=1 Tax=Hyphomicrobium sp. DMF-1 TaxID=3019544 RepID=UPI0022EBDF08|nr:amino acid permease [Hyphomicrobium sp. DMF-1]WBT36206.1 amino acid permease [Hyphomicrobium sp. DMF-1]HML41373.1 amino acid permease [Hyphomicrobium zavarzinii]